MNAKRSASESREYVLNAVKLNPQIHFLRSKAACAESKDRLLPKELLNRISPKIIEEFYHRKPTKKNTAAHPGDAGNVEFLWFKKNMPSINEQSGYNTILRPLEAFANE